MELSGTIKLIDATKEVGSGGFKKRDLVITTSEDYPQHILVQFTQDKCDILDGYAVGQEVIVGINLRGKIWVNPKGEEVYFNTIQGWKINKTQSKNPKPQGSAIPQMAPQQAFDSQQSSDDEEDSDLPF